MRRFLKVGLAAWLGCVNIAHAEIPTVDSVSPIKPKKEDKPLLEGWHFGVNLGATFQWTANSHFVGVTEGNLVALGGQIQGMIDFKKGINEWRNRISLLETYTKVPQINSIIKSTDQFSVNSTYLANLVSWIGPFAQVKMDTYIFPGQDVQAKDTLYAVTDASGQTQDTVASTLKLTTPFQPLYLQESAGAFAKAFDRPEVRWVFLIGPSFLQTFANGQRIITNQAADKIEVKTLSSFYQIGPWIGMAIGGEFFDSRITYRAEIDAMYVLVRTPQYTVAHSFGDLINVQSSVNFAFKLVDWMSLMWDFTTIRIPDVTPWFQIQSNVLLTFTYELYT